jgi:hypothetical protein
MVRNSTGQLSDLGPIIKLTTQLSMDRYLDTSAT